MSKIKKTVSVLILAVFAGALTAGCSKPAEQAPGGAQGKAAMAGGPGGGKFGRPRDGGGMRIETAVAAIKPISLEKQYVGEITPLYAVELKSTASGWLTSITVDIGDRVEKNRVIGELQNDEVKAQAEQARANISVSKASITRAEAELDRTVLENTRAKSLFGKGYISKREMEDAETAAKQAKASFEAAKAQLEQAEAQLKTIEVKLRDTAVKAPFAGVVAERYVDPGAYVSPANPIVRIEDNSRVKAVINIVEEDFSRVRAGDIAEVVTDSYPNEKFTGRIIRIAPSMNKASRTAPVEIMMSNPGGKLKGGMTARVNLILAKKPAALVIPETAIRRDVEKGFEYVFVVEKGTIRQRVVRVGIISSGEAEITQGLKPGEAAVNGDVRVSDGMKLGAPEGKGGRR